ncbi:outer membrane lipoprotein carrier protein LolA [Lutibacter sp.]|uniref:LolA family protein n=1 Tax=Lutibacter sp. TaxID=1925666 RepID=UPI0025C5B9D4|nr:outer membrane lipoprotein carrier protein LolA [Lutibacter sp.]MCF6181986.1 outer membrane lipoprotein carrier protein LolA [Lutibacter sp.]
MRKLLPILILSLVSFVGFSQNSKTAKDLLDEVAKKVESYKNIEIEFTHNLDNVDAGVHQETRGKVTVKGDLYHLNYMGTEQIFDGKKVYLIVNEDEEVIIQNPNNEDKESLTPSKMFTFYKSGYTYTMGDLKTIKGIKIQYVNLTPIDTNSDVKNILVGIDVKTKHIFNVIEIGKNKTTTTLEIRSFKTNQTLPDSLFTFNLKKYRDQKNYTISEPK